MRHAVTLSVASGTTHTVPIDHMNQLQAIINELGADQSALFLRLGAASATELQPVTARAVLAEIERFLPLIQSLRIPGVVFRGADGEELGGLLGGPTGTLLTATDESTLSITPAGIRVVLRRFPPPIGFRSSPALDRGQYECYFSALYHGAHGTLGKRTDAMGGSGALVELPDLPALPPVTRWTYARAAGNVTVSVTDFAETPVTEAYRDLLHAVTAACNDSLRLRRPLVVRRD